MGQKSLDAFFKRPASAQGAAKDASSTAAAAAGDGDAVQPVPEAVAGVPPQPPAAAAAAAGDGSAAEAAEDVHAAQASEQQRMRAAANRNAALAKQVRGLGCAGALSSLCCMHLCYCRCLSNCTLAASRGPGVGLPYPLTAQRHIPWAHLQVVIRAEQAGGLPRLGDLLIEPSWREALEGEMGKAYWGDLVRPEACRFLRSPPLATVQGAVWLAQATERSISAARCSSLGLS